VCGVSACLASLFIWLALTQPDDRTLVAALFACAFFAFVGTSPINVVIVNAVAPTMRATAMAVCIFVMHLLGDALAAPAVGLAADATSLGRPCLCCRR
jgi:predicted MFS family arabinose efflux permease